MSTSSASALVRAIDELIAFARKNEEESIDQTAMQVARHLDAKIRRLCKTLDIPSPPTRKCRHGLNTFLRFTQLPIQVEEDSGIVFLDSRETTTDECAGETAFAWFVFPDDQWINEMAGLRAEAELCEQDGEPVGAGAIPPTEASPKRKRGRPQIADLKQDMRLYEGWQDGAHKTHAEYARELGMSEQEVRLAIDRARKRRDSRTRAAE